ncbi:leucine--tRNA ligase [Candidatus Gracilibacteria bacterium]|nr:leucine--tRNA ligase [Candidatus Gracilibacteria bacterium]
MTIDIKSLAPKWQKKRKEAGVYKTQEGGGKPKYYVLDMFPYPSGAGLHVGHPKGYVASDVIARKKMLEGYNVLHPMGFDTFGLGTEQYAIDHKMKPQVVAEQNIKTYISQLEKIGFSYDWERSFSTADPEFYKWTQMIFLKFYNAYFDEKDQRAKPISELEEKLKKEQKSESEISQILDSERLAYLDYRPINRCPHCKTGLANEDLDDGKCERCGSLVEQRPMRQRVLRITKYAQRLLDGLDNLDRDESMKELERNWIGRSEGSQFKMKIQNSEDFFEVFTTRLDTVFGMSFVALAPEHPLVDKITTTEQKTKVQEYKEQTKHKTQLERTELQKEKTGVFTGAYAINPFNGKEIPIYIGDYVLGNYGTGAVMGVPAHDERDFDFAKKHKLEISEVVIPNSDFSFDFSSMDTLDPQATQKGVLVNSGEFSGLTSDEAIVKMQNWLAERNFGSKKVNYKIQDWVFSRQRYWGEPFPIIFSEGKTIALQESDLPLTLPDIEHYEPTGTEEGPLAEVAEWVNTTTTDRKPARRETNTMPGWAGSSRYWIRYMDPRNNDAFVGKDAEAYWQNVDTYIGGAEHVTRHIIYARFWQKFLYDLGMVSKDEPFQRYQKVGLIMAEDGRKMSKRRGNVINPDDVVAEYGADVLRTYEMFMGPFDQAIAWNTQGMKGVKKFLEKIIALWDKIDLEKKEEKPEIETLLHQTIKKLTIEIDEFKFNTSISQLMILVNKLSEVDQISKQTFEALIIMLAPFAPHLAEEFWEKLGNEFSLFTKGSWPKFDEKKLVSSIITLPVQINGKMRGTLQVSPSLSQDEILNLIRQDEKLASYLTGEIKKCILVPGKIINIIL